MSDYIPATLDGVRTPVEPNTSSGSTEGSSLLDTGLLRILVTHTGGKSGGIREIPVNPAEPA